MSWGHWLEWHRHWPPVFHGNVRAGVHPRVLKKFRRSVLVRVVTRVVGPIHLGVFVWHSKTLLEVKNFLFIETKK